MRILHVAQPITGGVSVVCQQLVRAGLERGYQVSFAGPYDEALQESFGPNVACHYVEMRRNPGVSDLGAIFKLRRLMLAADVVVAHSSKAGALCRLAKNPGAGPALVFMPHGWSWLVGGRMGPCYKVVEKLLASRCEAIVAVSEHERAAGRLEIGRKAESKLHLVVNGVDRSHFRPSEAMGGVGPVVLIGRLSVQKGQDIALRAWALLPPDKRPRLRLVGPGDPTELQGLADELGVADHVEFFGPDSDVRAHLWEASMVIIPSRWEGLALSLLEAMACGKAIVASSSAGAEALSGGAGLVIGDDGTDVTAAELAGAVAELAGDPHLVQQIQTLAESRARDYDLAATLAQHVALWETLGNR